MSKIKASNVNVSLESDVELSLQEFINKNLIDKDNISIYYFGSEININTILKAINFLKRNDGGGVFIPTNGSVGKTKIEVLKQGLNSYDVRYTYYASTYPTGTDARPYTGDDWQVGDMIYNIHIASPNMCTSWLCTEGGVPGTWVPYGINDFEELKRSIISNINKVVQITVPVSAWESDDESFVAEILNSNILDVDNLRADYVLPIGISDSDRNDMLNEYAKITDSYTEDGKIVFVAESLPSQSLHFVLSSALGSKVDVSNLLTQTDFANAMSSHLQSSNPHRITRSMIGAAASSHKHSVSDITSGLLPQSRGGTGYSSLESLISDKGLDFFRIQEGYAVNVTNDTIYIPLNNGLNIVMGYRVIAATANGYTAYSVSWEPTNYFSRNPWVIVTANSRSTVRNATVSACTRKGFDIILQNNTKTVGNVTVYFIAIG